MIGFQNIIFQKAYNPADINGTTSTGVSFDTAQGGGCGYVGFIFSIGDIQGNVTASSFKLQESDDDSSYSDVTGGGFTAPTAAGSDNTILCAGIDMRNGRKRYLRWTITAAANVTLVSGVWLGFRAVQSPNSTTERNVAQQIFI